MDKIFTLIVIFAMILFPIFLVIWIIQAIRKKPTKKLKIICLVILAVFVGSTAAAIAFTCDHEWNDATCSAPKTCVLCGETEGEVLQHQWEDATCSSARKCSLCGLTEGTPVGHEWTDATCAAPKTCSICGETEGDALGHMKDDWVVIQEAARGQVGIRTQSCTVCGDVIKSEEFNLDPIFYTTDFGISTAEFITIFNQVTDGEYEIKPDDQDYVVHWLGSLDISSSISFTENDSGLLTSISFDGRDLADHGHNQVQICLAMFRVLNPHLSEGDSIDEFKAAADSGGRDFIRGVRYLYTELDSLNVLWFTIQLD